MMNDSNEFLIERFNLPSEFLEIIKEDIFDKIIPLVTFGDNDKRENARRLLIGLGKYILKKIYKHLLSYPDEYFALVYIVKGDQVEFDEEKMTNLLKLNLKRMNKHFINVYGLKLLNDILPQFNLRKSLQIWNDYEFQKVFEKNRYDQRVAMMFNNLNYTDGNLTEDDYNRIFNEIRLSVIYDTTNPTFRFLKNWYIEEFDRLYTLFRGSL